MRQQRMNKKTLFLFTKQFPYGSLEKYVSDELPYLAEQFEEIILVPTEYFEDAQPSIYTLPPNTKVLLLNQLAKQATASKKKHWGEFMAVWWSEFFRHPFRHYLFRFFRRYISILLYQQQCADVFSGYLDREGIDANKTVFYTYWLHNSTLMLALLKRRGKISAFVTRAHSIDLYSEWWPDISEKRTPLPFLVFKLRWLDKIATISAHGAAHLSKHFREYAGKISCHRLGVDDLGLNDPGDGREFVIVTCSHLSENKRVQRMTGILELLDFPVRWIHFGGSGPAFEQLKQVVARLPKPVQVELRGQVTNAAIVDFYRHHPVHLFVNLSRMEGIPVSIMEAESFGIPAMATAVFGVPEIVNENNGHLLPKEFTDEEAAAFIRKLAADPALRAKLRANARKHFETIFNAPDNFKAFIAGVLRP